MTDFDRLVDLLIEHIRLDDWPSAFAVRRAFDRVRAETGEDHDALVIRMRDAAARRVAEGLPIARNPD